MKAEEIRQKYGKILVDECNDSEDATGFILLVLDSEQTYSGASLRQDDVVHVLRNLLRAIEN